LLRRVVFSIPIHKTDDHLRNHGFLLGPEGITLWPAFDINPSIDRNELTLAINEVESTCDVAIALEAHRAYGLSAAEAKTIVSKTREIDNVRAAAITLAFLAPSDFAYAAGFQDHFTLRGSKQEDVQENLKNRKFS
jgi:serine/threonine-protein kinase HipA